MKGWDTQDGEDLSTVTPRILMSKSCIKGKNI